jgi:coproporphyrinogen III oxidase-like Fe-S oxidoreductase
VTADGRMAQSTEKRPEAWLERVEAEGHALVENERLDMVAQGDEYLLMGLRLVEGIDPAVFKALSGRSLSETRVTSLILDGLLTRKPGGKIACTPEGALLLDAVVADLAA